LPVLCLKRQKQEFIFLKNQCRTAKNLGYGVGVANSVHMISSVIVKNCCIGILETSCAVHIAQQVN
jgi:hypothetical protein